MAGQKQSWIYPLVAALAIFGLRFLPLDWLQAYLPYVRGGLYALLFLLWGVSAALRVTRPQSRGLIAVFVCLCLLWTALELMGTLSLSVEEERFRRYLSAVPMLLLPFVTALLAGSMGEAETFRLPGWIAALWVLSACAVLFVLTNDLHRLVFLLPEAEGADWLPGKWHFVPLLWRYGAYLAALILVIARCFRPGKGRRLVLPVIPAALLAIYAVLSLLDVPGLGKVLPDHAAVECMLTLILLEVCLQTGLLPTNAHYDALFRAGNGAVILADSDFVERAASSGAGHLPPELLRQAQRGPVMLESGLRLSSAPIRDGHVLWVEDVSRLAEVSQELAGKSEYLTEQQISRQKELDARWREQDLSRRNRLYDKMLWALGSAVSRFSRLTEALESAPDGDDASLITAKLAVVCTELKRGLELVFLEEESGIPAEELSRTVEEWLASLRLAGARCGCDIDLASPVPLSHALALYDGLAELLLATLPGLRAIFIRLQEQEEGTLLLLDAATAADLSGLKAAGLRVEREGEGEWTLELLLPKGGTP